MKAILAVRTDSASASRRDDLLWCEQDCHVLRFVEPLAVRRLEAVSNSPGNKGQLQEGFGRCTEPFTLHAQKVHGKHLFYVAGRIVLLEQVFSEVAAEVTPYGVDVVGIVLRVVELDQE